MITPVVNMFGTYAVDSIPVYSDASDAHSTLEFPNIRCRPAKSHGISVSLQKWSMISRSHGNVNKSHGIQGI